MDANVREFLAEAEEILDRMADDLAELEGAQDGAEPDPEVVNSIFRGAHSLKGIAAMCGFGHITELSHKMEALLDGIRMGRVSVDRDVMDLLYGGLDLLKELCGRLAKGDPPEDPAVEDFVQRLVRAAEDEGRGEEGVLSSLGFPEDVVQVLTEYEVHRIEATLKNPSRTLVWVRVGFPFETFDTDLERLNEVLRPLGEIISTLPTPGAGAEERMDFQILFGLKEPVEALRSAVEAFGAEVEVLRPAPAVQREVPAPARPREPAEARPSRESEAPASTPLRSLSGSIRVDLAKLDRLMNLVGELVLARSHIQLVSSRLRERLGLAGDVLELSKAQKTLSRKLAELQQAVMDVRMVPLGQLFSKLQRVVHQILRGSDKEVDLEIQGADTELDKLIIEDLSDPLIHVIRNAVDHGIEPPQVREAKGKPRRGRIRIAAHQRGNHVVIEVEDDGAGINRERVRAKAVERGFIDPDAELDDRELLDLLFVPGFSTKDEPTEVSGRGVGMDVLRKNIARLSGMIELDSREGEGTRVTVVLPITLAIIQALLIRAGTMRFAVPLSSVLETVSVEPGQVASLEGRPVLRLRENTLPLVRLDRLFGVPEQGGNGWKYAVVVGVAEKRAAFAVDELVSQQDVVIKGLGTRLEAVRGIAGATDLGDQRPILVLDVAALVEEVFAHA